jgi:hypothetical protein
MNDAVAAAMIAATTNLNITLPLILIRNLNVAAKD